MAGKLVLRLIMPSAGDMELVAQEGGVINLEPVFYGNESMGPHIQVVEGHKVDGGKFVVDKILGRYRLKIKEDGKVEFKKGQA